MNAKKYFMINDVELPNEFVIISIQLLSVLFTQESIIIGL